MSLGQSPSEASTQASWRQRQSFRSMSREFQRGPDPALLELTAVRDMERLGATFSNQMRFRGPDPPEETPVPFLEQPADVRSAMTRSPMSPQASLSSTAPVSSIYAGRPKQSLEQRRARLAMTFATPLYGVEFQRGEMFQDFLRQSGKLPSRTPEGLQKSMSASELMKQPKMAILSDDLPDRVGFLYPSWDDKKRLTPFFDQTSWCLSGT
eukprot:TRINITY_DN22634_c0_g1_i1.p1 TRINITY_DN22634_c0_g1~~TRINITY_DN22634_c0_g1_i1.p1  ORF type:complete len:210 (-),score=28.95 TRINITY_DN22634_c0_g1_i1:99-728(-)